MITYLASPYTPTQGESITSRVQAATSAAARLMNLGHIVFSPIVHSHYIAEHLEPGVAFDHEFWMKQDLEILKNCGLLVVLTLEGFERSKGVAREMLFAKEHGIPIIFMEHQS